MSSYNSPYLDDTKAPMQLLGLSGVMNPFPPFTSSQRGVMWNAHMAQAQCISGCEFPRVYSGIEPQVGDYEYNTTNRDQDIQIIEKIPKYPIHAGMFPIKDNPMYTIIYRGVDDNKIGYFNIEKFTVRSDGYGYPNKWLNPEMLNKGNVISKDLPLCTSPSHKGSKYCMGTNLQVCYMSHPWVTEDAFVISESAARKLQPVAYGHISFKILPTQIPRNLYGTEEEYKFFPDIGETVREDGVLCALMVPTKESIIFDMAKENIGRIQYMYDTLFYAPVDARIVDVDIVINKKCKVRTPKEMFTQVQKYREPMNNYWMQIWKTYHKYVVQEGREITPAFNTLVYKALCRLQAEDIRIPNYSKRADLTLVKKKEIIEYLHITLTYQYPNPVQPGMKLSGRFGNKGVISKIIPDEDMPTDAYGCRAELIIDPSSVFNRMNMGQWYEQFIARGSWLVTQRIRAMFTDRIFTQEKIDQAYEYALSYMTDVHPNYGNLIREESDTPLGRQQMVESILQEGIYVQCSPFQDNISLKLIEQLRKKYEIDKTQVQYAEYRHGERVIRTTKQAVLIGEEYMHLLYKMPHLRSSGMSYVNQYHSPIHPNKLAKLGHPVLPTPIRFGEDECRNGITTNGAWYMSRLFGLYANSPDAVKSLAHHLLNDQVPSQLDHVEIGTKDIIKSNNIIGVAKHIFSCFGVNITPEIEPQRESKYGNLDL